ncbi:MAG: cytochrome P450 [Deltaproteobacteria bacterium]|nr:MAG: cytochrome P450 [Deltaproteobacteria bacterium]
MVTEVLRTLKQPLTLGEWHLPEGHSVAVATALIHADPELYPEPHAFRPDRFRSFQPRPWEYLPFGGGIRRCIGAAFATHEMQQVLGVLLDGLDVTLASPHPATPVRRSITMAPSEGVRARCALRAQADRGTVAQGGGREA